MRDVMKIDNSHTRAWFDFTPADYVLVKTQDGYALAPRIDRSVKGKDDDIGPPVLSVTDEQADKLFQSGFSFVTEL